MGRYKRLFKNTAIFSISTFGGKIFSFLIVPMYSYVLTTAEYGRIDLFATALNLMVPLSMLLVSEAGLRFIVSGEGSSRAVLANSMAVFFYSIVFTLALIPVYIYLLGFGEYTWLYVLALILRSFTEIFTYYLKATDRNAAYAVCCFLQVCTILSLNVLFLLRFRWGLRGYLYAMVLSYTVQAVCIAVSGRLMRDFSPRYIDLPLLRQMLRYCVPLIPNSLVWWIMSGGDKYIINFFMGDSANGLYSMALKIPSIVTMVYGVFSQAWGLAAIEEMHSRDNGVFYNNIFSLISLGLCLVAGGVMLIVEPLFRFVLDDSFYAAWRYVPLLCVAAVLQCFGTFASVTYSVTKRSRRMFVTTFAGAAVNVVLNCVLIGSLELYGVALATVLGYGVILVIRFADLRRDMGIVIPMGRIYLVTALLLAQAGLVTLQGGAAGWAAVAGLELCVCGLYRTELAQGKALLKSAWERKRKGA